MSSLVLDAIREDNLHTIPMHSPTAGRRRLDAFDIVCLIGKGGFGKVFLVRHKATAQVYAMKVMEKELLIRRKAVRDAHAERNILAMVGESIDTNFIVKLHVAFQTSKRVYLVMDFASGGELMFHLRREAMLSEEATRFYAAELLIALESLHKMHICHRDIKPENVLLDGDGHLVLTDLGLAKELTGLGDQTHSWCGSEDYMAPETLAREAHTGKPADYWAYGVFLYDCLCGEPPFSPLREKGKTTRKKLHERILKCKYRLPPYLSRECHSLIRGLMTRAPEKRLTDPDKIRAHPWFRKVDWDAVRERRLTPPIVPPQGSPTACFSPSITKVDCSIPHSPLGTYSNGTDASAISIPGARPPSARGATPSGSPQLSSSNPDSMWQGFSFVAPGMEVHFELAPSCPKGGNAYPGSNNTKCTDSSSVPCLTGMFADQLAAELAEFSVDAAEAVEITNEH